MLDDRNLRALRHGADQTLAAARQAQIDQVRERQQFLDGLAVGSRHDLDGLRGKIPRLLLRRLDHDFGEHTVGIQRFLAAAQNGRVAGLQAEAGGIGGHIRA